MQKIPLVHNEKTNQIYGVILPVGGGEPVYAEFTTSVEVAEKQGKSDENLETEDKTIVGAINEVNKTVNKVNTEVTTLSTEVDDINTKVGNLTGAFVYRGKFTALPPVNDYQIGDVVTVGSKEYVCTSDTEKGDTKIWVEFGDEANHITKDFANKTYALKEHKHVVKDISDFPEIPVVNDPAVTVKFNGVEKGKFTLNQKDAKEIDLGNALTGSVLVPIRLSDDATQNKAEIDTFITNLHTAGIQPSSNGYTIPVVFFNNNKYYSGILSTSSNTSLNGIVTDTSGSKYYPVTVNVSTGEVTFGDDNYLLATNSTELQTLSNAISTEVSERKAADVTFTTKIGEEVTARDSADTTLQTNINAEASARDAAIKTVKGLIDNETAARKEADSKLQTTVNGKVDRTRDGINAAINLLDTASATPVDADYYISQYAGGGEETKTYHRRPLSALWKWIESKVTAIYKYTYTPITLTDTVSSNKTQLDTVLAVIPAAQVVHCIYNEVYAGTLHKIGTDWYGQLVKNTNNYEDAICVKVQADGTLIKGTTSL